MFETLDAVLLARIQFAFTVSFHIIFPAFTIGEFCIILRPCAKRTIFVPS